MISNDEELQVMFDRIDRFENQVTRLRQVESNQPTIDSQRKAILPKSTE